MKPKVLVLLSTYNGERYLEAQLDSLVSQQGVELSVLIRDDGSSDGTISILESYIERYPGIMTLYKGANLGAKKSFFNLIKQAKMLTANEYDYVAFCDQDDVWLENKLFKATAILGAIAREQEKSLPQMYCSATQMVRHDLTELDVWPKPLRNSACFYNAMVENIAVGCTCVLNLQAFQLIADHLPLSEEDVIMHDWWIYLCISAFGKVVFDPEPNILYRQHDQNVLGGATDRWITKWIKRFQRYFRGKNHFIISKQAKVFYELFHHRLESNQAVETAEFIVHLEKKGLFSRMRYSLRTPFYRQSSMDNLILKLIYTLGKV